MQDECRNERDDHYDDLDDLREHCVGHASSPICLSSSSDGGGELEPFGLVGRHACLELVVLGHGRLEALLVGIEGLVGHERHERLVPLVIDLHLRLELGEPFSLVLELAVDAIACLGLGAFLLL